MISILGSSNNVCKKYFLILVNGCTGFFSLCCCITFLLIFGLFIATLYKTIDTVHIIYIDSQKPFLHKVNTRFLSIGLDDIVIAENFKGFNMTDKKLIKMIRYLHPGYLRIGGNLADKLRFSSNGTDNFKTDFYECCDTDCDYVSGPNYTMTGNDWLRLCNLAKQSQMDVVFDLNALIRFENGSWDYRNAEELIDFSNNHNLLVNWELGNEPNSYQHKFNEEVNATQLAKDFKVLKNILKNYALYKNSLLVGPDVTRIRDKETAIFFEEFLEAGVVELNAITWHHYYLNGRVATAADFLNPETYDSLIDYIYRASSIMKSVGIDNKPMWLGETASAYGGGAPGLSDRFIACFIWLDKLGLSAKLGIDVVVRQSIFHGNYALLDDNYDPNPDWWISLLHKKLLDMRVVPSYTASSTKVRLYCHCTNNGVFQGLDVVNFPSITVFGLNVLNKTSYVRIEGIDRTVLSHIFSFVVTSYDSSLLTKNVVINGKIAALDKDNRLPKIVPRIVNGKNVLRMPAFSIVFWIIPNVEVTACS